MHRTLVSGIIVIFIIGSIVAIVFLLGGERVVGEGNEYFQYPHHPFYVSISADGGYILARYRASESFVQLFGRENNVPIWSISPPTLVPSYWTEASAITADGNYIVVGTREWLYLFSENNNEPLWSYPIYVEPEAAAISSDGSYVAAGTDGSAYVFTKTDNAPILSSSTGEVRSISMSSDGNYIAVGTWWTLYMFTRTDNDPLWSYQPGTRMDRAAISADGNYIIGGGERRLYLFGREDNTSYWSYEFPTGTVWLGSISISADGSYIIVDDGGGIQELIDAKNRIYVFTKNDNTPLQIYQTGEWIRSSSIPPDGSYIAAGGERKLYLYSRNDNAPLWSYEFPEHVGVRSISVSTDGSYIAVGTEGGPRANIGGSVYLFDKNGTLLWSYHHEVEPYVSI